MKRSRQDGQVSKEQYYTDEAEPSSHALVGWGGGGGGGGGSSSGSSSSSSHHAAATAFQRATPSTLATRRLLKPKKVDRRREYLEAVKALNSRFQAWVVDQVKKDPTVSLADNALEYLSYVSQLDARYLRKQGEVFTFGSSECGQCAHGDRSASDILVTSPRVVYSLRGKSVCNIACGALHNVAATSDGRVYTWGCNDDGAVGREGNEAVPMLVTDIRHETVIGVAAGDSHSLVCTLEGAVYGWGCYKDKEGKMFFNATSERDILRKQVRPMKLPGLEHVLEIRSGVSSNLALLSDSTVVSWGIGESGELGRAITLELREPADQVAEGAKPEYELYRVWKEHLTPRPMQLEGGRLVTGVKAIGAGYNHSLVVMAINSEVWATGLNNYGQLGLGHTTNQHLLQHVEALDDKAITETTGGAHFSMALSGPTGRLYAFGRSDSSQLGIGKGAVLNPGASESLPVPVQFPPEAGTGRAPFVTAISSGGTFNLAVTAHNQVYTWGFGEMGQLGHKPAKGKDSVDEPVPRPIDFSQATQGATSFEVLKADGGAQHSVILAKVPVAYLDEVKRKLEEGDARYRQRLEEKRRQSQGRGQEEEEEDEELEFEDL